VQRDLSPRLGAAGLAVVVAFALTTSAWFIRADHRPCNINELSHIMGAIDFANLAPVRPSLYSAYLEAFNGYPPIGILTSGFYAVFGRTHDVAAASQLPFTALLLIALYLLGSRLVDRRTGLLAAWLAATSPATVELSRQYLLEMPLTALTTLAVLLLIMTDRFTERRWSIAAGLAVGLAALAKQTFFIFLIGPILWAFPAWWRAVREQTPPPEPEAPPRRRVSAAIAAGSLLISWMIYGFHRTAIENWFAAYPQYQLPYGWIFFVLTAGLLFAAGTLVAGRSTPLRNGLLAMVLAVLVASLWYFPKGVLNFITYVDQMRLNVDRSGMSPQTLLSFYRAHATTYYMGLSTWAALAAAVAVLGSIVAAGRWLGRWFYLRNLLPSLSFLALVGLWFGVPFAAFFFINIQNEMNTVPLVPPLTLLAATVITRLRLPYAAKAKKALESGGLHIAPRLAHGAMTALRVVVLAWIVAGGVLMTMPWKGEKGAFLPLPEAINTEKRVETWFHRKLDPIAYLVPKPAEWHEVRIAEALFAEATDFTSDFPPARVLAMDVEFYFSWNTFWYMAKLLGKRVEIRTPWYADADILDPSSPDYVETFDRILYRSAFDRIYHEEKIRNDYKAYKNLLAGYTFLQQRPADFAARFPVVATFPLPDGTEATVLRRAVLMATPDGAEPESAN